jgi:SAM-dependent methyltransferase
MEKFRAERIFEICNKFKNAGKLNILDYGGASGNILIPFLNQGHNCHLIDYAQNILPGIKKIGNDINNFKSDRKYDLIICSHVLEHVADIPFLMEKLRELLSPDGIIYAEVPREIWGGLRIDIDPVTHINFFTLNSFQNLFGINKFEILERKQGVVNYKKSFFEAIWVVAKKSDKSLNSLFKPDIGQALYPSRLYSFKRIFKTKLDSFFAKLTKN